MDTWLLVVSHSDWDSARQDWELWRADGCSGWGKGSCCCSRGWGAELKWGSYMSLWFCLFSGRDRYYSFSLIVELGLSIFLVHMVMLIMKRCFIRSLEISKSLFSIQDQILLSDLLAFDRVYVDYMLFTCYARPWFLVSAFYEYITIFISIIFPCPWSAQHRYKREIWNFHVTDKSFFFPLSHV